MASAGVDLQRMATFIQSTLDVGGKVSKLTQSVPAWIKLLKDDEDFQFLLDGCAYGFTWESSDPAEFFEVPNYVPAEHEQKITERIAAEVAAGRYILTSKDKVHGISAMGVVDKQRSGFVKYRVVHDYSRPKGGAVNDNMAVDKAEFARFTDACSCLRSRAYFAKVDLSDAYRSVPLAEEWWARQAFQWKGQVYMDLRMPFGNSGCPAAFNRITQAIVRLFKSWGFPSFIGYLDDFWLMIAD